MIELENLSFSYGDEPMLQNISARFPAAKLCAILGPNGSGKTTLLRLMARQRRPSDGKLSLGGKPYSAYERKDFAKQLALLPQSRPVPAISVRELVSHGRFPYLDLSRRMAEEDDRIVDMALENTDTARFASKDLRELSGGERQRVYLAMLIAQDTPYVLLDEPTTYLDISAQFNIMENLRRMSKEGKCVVTVLHDLPLALCFCDEICLLEKGRIAAHGSPEEIVSGGALERVFGVKCLALEYEGKKEYIFRPIK